jgi:hypothetical protein
MNCGVILALLTGSRWFQCVVGYGRLRRRTGGLMRATTKRLAIRAILKFRRFLLHWLRKSRWTGVQFKSNTSVLTVPIALTSKVKMNWSAILALLTGGWWFQCVVGCGRLRLGLEGWWRQWDFDYNFLFMAASKWNAPSTPSIPSISQLYAKNTPTT